MANILGNFAKYGKEKFTQLDSKLNFVISSNIATYFGVNGKKDDRNLILNGDNFRLQIGKMDKKNETIYSKEIILGGLEYLLKKVGNNDKIIIQLRPDLARYLCNEDQQSNKDNILKFEQEEEIIKKLIKKYFKNKSDQVEIINISNQYPEIFSILKKEGRKGLESKDKPKLDTNNFSALEIAKYLYRSSQKNKKFMQLIYNTKSHKQKQEDSKAVGENESDYYALIEIAIRTYEILKGINIQGGIDRQTKYDRIIGGIVYGKDIDNFKTKDYPELNELHNFCHNINSNIEFERVYIATKEIREIESKKIEKSKFKNQIILYTSIALISALSGIGGYNLAEYYKDKKQEEKNEKLMEETLSNKHSRKVYFDFRERQTVPGLKIRVSEATEGMYNNFLQIYGTGKADDKTLNILKSLIKQYFLQADTTGALINIDKVYDSFLVQNKLNQTLKDFVWEYAQFLTENGFDIIPQAKMQDYNDACKYTQDLKGNIGVNFFDGADSKLNVEFDSTKYQKEYDQDLKEFKAKGMTQQYYPIHTFGYERYGNYLQKDGKQYDVLIIRGQDGKKILLAYEREYGEEYFNSKQVHLYTKENGEKVAKDFLENRTIPSISAKDNE